MDAVAMLQVTGANEPGMRPLSKQIARVYKRPSVA